MKCVHCGTKISEKFETPACTDCLAKIGAARRQSEPTPVTPPVQIPPIKPPQVIIQKTPHVVGPAQIPVIPTSLTEFKVPIPTIQPIMAPPGTPTPRPFTIKVTPKDKPKRVRLSGIPKKIQQIQAQHSWYNPALPHLVRKKEGHQLYPNLTEALTTQPDLFSKFVGPIRYEIKPGVLIMRFESLETYMEMGI